MKLSEKIHLLKLDFEIQVNTETKLQRFVNIIIILGEKITLIDTGVKTSFSHIQDYLQVNGREISEIDRIILSHAHPDHIGTAAKLKEISGCKIIAHQAEKDWMENIQLQFNERPVPGFFNLVDTSILVDEYISLNQVIEIEQNIHLEIFHAPGHSKGSINILFQEDGILFTADSIPLKGDIPNYDNFPQLIKTVDDINNRNGYHTLLSSWTVPLFDRHHINILLSEGSAYMLEIDNAIKLNYLLSNLDENEACINTLKLIGLPPFLAVPVVLKAFRSHIY